VFLSVTPFPVSRGHMTTERLPLCRQLHQGWGSGSGYTTHRRASLHVFIEIIL